MLWIRLKEKFKEQYLAVQLEHAYTKDEIMIAYLNTINLGNRSYGVEMAAQNYFGKHVWQLNLSESAVIAAIALSPVYRNPITNPEKMQKDVRHVLKICWPWDIAPKQNMMKR